MPMLGSPVAQPLRRSRIITVVLADVQAFRSRLQRFNDAQPGTAVRNWSFSRCDRLDKVEYFQFERLGIGYRWDVNITVVIGGLEVRIGITYNYRSETLII